MKRFLHVIMLLGVLMVGAAFLFHPSVAESANDEVRFVDGVIEVPEGTTVIFDDDSETVIIKECPVDIQKGDTFVVYLKELPIGYVAKSIDVRNDETIISVQKADKSVYANFEKEGSIELTPDMYTFIPAEGISYMEGTTQSGISIGGGDGLGYSNGKLTLSKSFGGNKIQMSLSNLSINYAASDGNMSLSLGGKWELSTPAMSVSEDILDDIPCGQIRIAGIGKISIKMSMKIGMSMTCNFSGSFRVGFSMASGNADSIIREFSCDSKKVSGKGKISASLKVTAGIDVVFASADIYGAVGVATELDTKSTTDQNTHKTTSCANYRIYVFLEAGAEAKVFSPISGDLKPVYGYDFNIPDNIAKPYSIDIHFENGSLVGNCTKGMSIPDRSFGGFSTSFGSTILTDSRMRILESKVSLPWDTIVDNDLFVANGNLRLNGHTLTIKGNLIQSGGTITVEDGTLIVEGDYRIQTLDQETGVFAGSTGSLIMKNEEGKVIVSGDVVIQTKSSDNKLDYGTISVGKNLYQKNEDGNSVNLKASANCHIVMSGGNSHSIVLDNPEGNYLGTLHVLGNTTIPHSMHLDGAQIIESTLRIQGDLRLEGGVLEL